MNRSVLCSAEGSEAEDAWVRCRHFHRHRLNCCSVLFQEHTVGDVEGGSSSPATGPRDKPREMLGDYKRTKQSCWYNEWVKYERQNSALPKISLLPVLSPAWFEPNPATVWLCFPSLFSSILYLSFRCHFHTFLLKGRIQIPCTPNEPFTYNPLVWIYTVLICFPPSLLSVPPMSLFPPNFGFILRYDLPTSCSHQPHIAIYMFEAFLSPSLALFNFEGEQMNQVTKLNFIHLVLRLSKHMSHILFAPPSACYPCQSFLWFVWVSQWHADKLDQLHASCTLAVKVNV